VDQLKYPDTSQDSIFERMTFDQWQAALDPKHAATWNLHNQLPNLDFFIMLSSLTGVAGNIGLANYSAGCAFQDTFARWRTSQGLPAVSIDLGPVKDIGYVAENQNVMERVAKLGWNSLEKLDAMCIIESAMLHPCRPPDQSQIIVGVPRWEADTNLTWTHDLRFSSMQKNIAIGESKSRGSASPNKAVPFKDIIAHATSLGQATQCCTDVLVQKLANMFSLQAADVDSSFSLAAYGVDSLVAVELRNWLAVTIAADVSVFDIIQSSSVANLSAKVARRSRYVPLAVAR
jgi:hypothetical protein